MLWTDSLVAGKLVGSYTVAGYYLLQQKNHYIVAAASHWLGSYKYETIRPYLVGKKFYVFCIQTFRKQGKRV